MMSSWCRAVLLVLCLLAPMSAFAGDIVGDIIALDGKVTLRNDKAQELDARVGMQVETGQLIKTAEAAPWKSGLPTARSSGLLPNRPLSSMTSRYRVLTAGR